MDMDHHCFFLNNCVGRNNLKPFLLFLGWMLLGSLYLINCVLYLLTQRWNGVVHHVGVSCSGLGCLVWGKQMYYTVLIAPGWIQTCAFLLTTATGAAFGVAALLRSQLALLLRGRTYISSLQHEPVPAAIHLSYVQLAKLLWTQSSPCWAWPAWHTELHAARHKHL